MLKLKSASLKMLLSVPVMLLTACSVVPKPLPPNVPIPPVIQPAQIPALPPEARQPKTPELCSPTCSEGLRKLLENLLQ